MSSLRKSRFLEIFKRRSRRRDTQESKASSDEFHSLPTSPTADEFDDQRDGFYQYGESLTEDPLLSILPPYEEPSRDDSLKDTHPDDSSMAPRKRHSRPYVVSSEEWVAPLSSPSSPRSQVFSLQDLTDVQRAAHFGAVLKIFTKVYAIAKVLHVAFLGYGVQLDHSDTGLLYWIKRAETEIRTDSLATLIEIVENLFYALYSRLVLEMANIELCALFKMEARPATTHLKFVLPDPNHLYRIFLLFKDLLDSPSLCEAVQKDVVMDYQELYIRRIIDQESGCKIALDDVLGFRRHAVNIVSERTSPYYKKWNKLITFFDSIPADVMAVLAERYLTLSPKFVPEDDIPSSDLPFIDLRTTDPQAWEREIILDHRIATLAKLEGKSVGEERRDDRRGRLLALAKYQKCICLSCCSCAHDCTYDVERLCPCSERQLRIMLIRRRKGPGTSDFMTRANTLGLAFFRGVTCVKPNTSDQLLTAEMENFFVVFELEILKERASVPASAWT